MGSGQPRSDQGIGMMGRELKGTKKHSSPNPALAAQPASRHLWSAIWQVGPGVGHL